MSLHKYQLFSFRLQPTSRFRPSTFPRLGTWTLPGFGSLSALSPCCRDEWSSRFKRSPLSGFHNLSAGTLAPTLACWFIPPS